MMLRLVRQSWCALLAACFAATTAHAAELITLKNGFDYICDHHTTDGSKVRLYQDAAETNYQDVNASDIVSVEHVDLPRPVETAATAKPIPAPVIPEKLTDADLQPMLAKAGTAHNVDADLLASVVRAESAGHSHAISRAGAQGLMQLMPGTASDLGVADTFAPNQNIQGGSAYLDWLLTRYHDDLKKALAAYNAGPAAVDRWHGIPPYRETQLYVARVIREYNRRYAQRHQAEARVAEAR
jgi:soluble lytic murein transglycosylase-like protein